MYCVVFSLPHDVKSLLFAVYVPYNLSVFVTQAKACK
jgi:hypothetical protein